MTMITYILVPYCCISIKNAKGKQKKTKGTDIMMFIILKKLIGLANFLLEKPMQWS